ncbi:LOW QUALITY PROTEIN: cingulin-like protein 1 [Notechis scutatus]|uniref:LOW QUALITY PROTEIN: cingulin-like protein 1 n=1 Tax=Notechis scutatus TaxID=8663 RepID=A0A6J1VAW5_9SAUR|nr:LOW QUALITY PROTEIN: cingulin-like protein 1 [Notechis scutatus]
MMKSSPNGFRPRDRVSAPELATRESPPNAKAGSYGVTVRVQGIDGHPYLVLNNTEGGLSANLLGPENGQQVAADQPAADSALPALGLIRKSHEGRPFGRLWDNVPPSWIKSLKQVSSAEGKEATSPSQAEISQASNLLNFQKYPELLQPYNPANSILNLKDLQPRLLSKSQSLEDEGKSDSRPWNRSLRGAALGDSTPQFAELAKSKPKTVDLTRSYQNKQQLGSPSEANHPGGRPEWLTSGAGPSPAAGSSACPDPRKCRPDLLPFRQPDSAGAALNGSQKSFSPSTTPTSATSVSRFFLDDQEYAIYADHVNRHENRRYIPFLPGTGRDIDTGSTPAVEELIEKFDRKVCPQRSGRLGFRTRTLPENPKRSKSVDSAWSHGPHSGRIGDFTRNLGRSSEHLVQSSQVCLQKPLSPEKKATPLGKQVAPPVAGKLQTTPEMRASPSSHFGSLQYLRQDQMNPESLPLKSSTLPRQRKKRDPKTLASTLLLPESTGSQTHSKMETFASGSKSAQVTPDLLKGQQELAQQSNEETAKQILYNYLKEGTRENEDATKRKVNLVFEKIQTLKSRAAGSPQTPGGASVEVDLLVEEKKRLTKEVSELQRKLDLEFKSQQNFKAERQTMEAELQKLRQQLEENREEKDTLRRQLKESENDLRENLEELFQMKMEREQHQREIRDLQDQLSEMHDELDSTKHAEGEKEQLIEELMQMKQELQVLLVLQDQQEKILKKRERELTALKGVLKEEMASQDREIGHLKEQHVQELQSLSDSLAKATEEIGALSSAKAEAEKAQRSHEGRLAGMAEQNGQLRRALGQREKQQQDLQLELEDLRGGKEEAEERLRSCMREMQSLSRAKEEACQLASAKVSLEAQLEDTQRKIGRLSQEQQQLMGCLEDEASQKDQLQKTKRELEKERQQLDGTVETLQKEMAEIVKVSQESTQKLQKQLDEYKEKNQQQLRDSQQQLQDKTLELEKASQTILRMQEQVRCMEEELQGHKKAQKEILTKTRLLEDTVKNLEYELETKSHWKEDRARQAKILEDKISQLQLELEEERNNSDILSGRIGRDREQMEQMRSKLLQERTARQELEGDKTTLERQNKELRGQILHLEASHKPSKEGLVAQVEARLLELEEQLESEERDRAHLQLSNRRLERTVKELLMQVDDEHLSLTDQKDQLSLRLKAMKRQVEEAEEEIDRLENTKKKLQRELEDQVDLNDQLQGQLTTIRQDLRRQKTSSKLLSDFDYEDDEDFSTDGESLLDAPLGLKSFKHSDGQARKDANALMAGTQGSAESRHHRLQES